MAKHKFASISLTVRDRAISSKFSIHRVSEQCTLCNFQKIFLFPHLVAILNFRIFAQNGKTQIYFYLLNRAKFQVAEQPPSSPLFPTVIGPKVLLLSCHGGSHGLFIVTQVSDCFQWSLMVMLCRPTDVQHFRMFCFQ